VSHGWASVRTSPTLGRHSSAIRAACANERSCGSARGAISNGRPYRDRIENRVVVGAIYSHRETRTFLRAGEWKAAGRMLEEKSPERGSPIHAPAPGTRRPVRGEVFGYRRFLVGGTASTFETSGMVEQRPYFPVPESCTVCVPTASLILNVAERAPVAAGVKVTVMVQSQPALRLVPHADFSVKSPRSVPPSV